MTSLDFLGTPAGQYPSMGALQMFPVQLGLSLFVAILHALSALSDFLAASYNPSPHFLMRETRPSELSCTSTMATTVASKVIMSERGAASCLNPADNIAHVTGGIGVTHS